MDEPLDEILDDRFGQLSLNVSKSPLALSHWEELLNYLLERASPLKKLINSHLLELIRDTYKSLFTYFPLLENYSIDYALLEYKLGNIKEMHMAFVSALQRHNNGSLLLWLEYLKLCNEVVINHKQLFRKYELAESCIGLHFYSGEFWEMYLDQLRLRCVDKRRYLVVLRKVLELPIYSYSKFYAQWLNIIDETTDVRQLTMMVSEADIDRKMKIKIRGRGRKGPQLQEGKTHLRKFTKELYMVVQYRVLEIYNLFESNIKTHYYCSAETLIEKGEISAWWRYLEYSINNGFDKLTHLNFQRALLPLAHYEMIWIKYAMWLMQQFEDFVSAKSVLALGLQLSHKKTKIIELLCGCLIKLGDYDQLFSIFNQAQAVFGNNIEETDDFELFSDYLQFTMFMEKCISENFPAGTLSHSETGFKVLMKRLSYGENKRGQEELLHMVCQMYKRFSRRSLEENVFLPIIDQNWTYYLDNAKFWYEYCHRVWFDQDSSYLEKRRYIVKKLFPLVASQKLAAKEGVISFCESYMPEDLDVCFQVFKL
ncbi:LADA_0D06590g1_1 [Lachancea dasiensis]|uniref:LADA_0D06590g1_1 n=1 Tax=Lachancea dasiensis TaxID=1072105 RepID=A0A1G4J696_9SACH|nr:LADA_0D06590g1_1 [Lachancea dasiensis]